MTHHGGPPGPPLCRPDPAQSDHLPQRHRRSCRRPPRLHPRTPSNIKRARAFDPEPPGPALPAGTPPAWAAGHDRRRRVVSPVRPPPSQPVGLGRAAPSAPFSFKGRRVQRVYGRGRGVGRDVLKQRPARSARGHRRVPAGAPLELGRAFGWRPSARSRSHASRAQCACQPRPRARRGWANRRRARRHDRLD